ncbi:MAG: hypothetical protein FK730_12835 [Asgard group archaeon]|nr:hypothetical protein [Asgard group archaeon]
MNEKGNQAIFMTGKIAEIFNEIEIERVKQNEMLSTYLKNQIKPINDLWVAVSSQVVGKVAKSVENNDYSLTQKLILKFIAQLIVWLEFFENETLDEVTLKTKLIHNPSFNTILVKLMGELSRETLRNNAKKIQEKITTMKSFCDLWLERFKTADTQLTKQKTFSKELKDKYWHFDDSNFEELHELFSELDEMQ